MTTLAFKATYSDWKLIKTRGVVQVVMEVPLSEADAAYQILGGMPDFSEERWFGIAPLKPPPAEKEKSALSEKEPATPQPPSPPAAAKRDWRDVPPTEQAGIHCSDAVFIAFLKEHRTYDWNEARDAAECVRMICGVESRKLLNTDHRARMIWHGLDSQFQAWKIGERVGA